MTIDARKERFELVEVLGHPMLFTGLRVDRSTVPKGLYLYEVRNDDDQCGLPIELEPNKYNNNAYRSIDPEKDWNYTGEPWTVREYMDNYLPKKEREKPRER